MENKIEGVVSMAGNTFGVRLAVNPIYPTMMEVQLEPQTVTIDGVPGQSLLSVTAHGGRVPALRWGKEAFRAALADGKIVRIEGDMEAMLAEECRSLTVAVIYSEGNFVEFSLPVAGAEAPHETLERVFAGFNAGSRQEMPVFLAARVRSLSVDDFVVLDGKAWKCEGAGWSEIALSRIEVAIAENTQGARGSGVKEWLRSHPEWPCIQNGKRPAALRVKAIEPSLGSGAVVLLADDLPAEVGESSGPKQA
jgi:hypothetical protein